MKKYSFLLSILFILQFLVGCEGNVPANQAKENVPVNQLEPSISVNQLLEKVQQPLKESEAFLYKTQGQISFKDGTGSGPGFGPYDFTYNARANNEPFKVYAKGQMDSPATPVHKHEQYVIGNNQYLRDEGDDIVIKNWFAIAFAFPSPYDSIIQTKDLVSGLSSVPEIAKVTHKDGTYIIKIDISPERFNDLQKRKDVDTVFNAWFQDQFKPILKPEGYVDLGTPQIIFNFKQTMFFDDKTFMLKKMSREIKSSVVDVNLSLDVQGTTSEKVVLPQEIIDNVR